MIPKHITFPTNGDDYIGNESCIDLQNENDVDQYDTSKSNDDPAPCNQAKEAKISSRKKKEKRVFPPPIPLLARTQNLACHMPWVLKRYYTSEGRLILKEEKVRYHEYFRAHRENGRLTLQLVPLDEDEDEFLEEAGTSPHEEIDEDSTHDQSIIIADNDRFEDEEDKSSNVVVADSVENDNVVGGDANGGLNCLNCSSVRSAPSCIFGVPVHPIRTVHG